MTNEMLKVGGFTELTAANGELFRNQMCAALDGYTSIEIDLSRTTFMDCTGLGALIALHKCTHARQGVIRLVNPTPKVQRLFDAVHAGALFEIVNSPPAEPRVFADDVDSPPPCPSSLPDGGVLQAVGGGAESAWRRAASNCDAV